MIGNMKHCTRGKACMKVEADSFAARLGWVRKYKLGISQKQMCARVVEIVRRKDPKFTMTPAGWNKFETGDTATPKHVILAAISEITGCSLDYLILGKEPPPEPPSSYYSDDADRIAVMADDMLPRSRILLTMIAEGLLRIDEEQNESDARLSQLLLENINTLANGHRAEAREYIERTETARRRVRRRQRD